MRSRDRNVYEACGSVYFVTSVIVGHVGIFTRDELCQVFLDTLDHCQSRGDFVLLAWVLMPDHFHLVLKREPGKSISAIIGNLKRYTSRRITETLEQLGLRRTLAELQLAAKDEPTKDSAVWKYRFDSLVITSEETLRQKINYIHNNPIRRGLANSAEDWRYSSAVDYAGKVNGLLSVDTNWTSIAYSTEPSGKDS